jgi:hypothetical protein
MDVRKALRILDFDCDITNITSEQLKKRYYKLALKNHPDKNGNTHNFQEINEAYNFLNNNILNINDEPSQNDNTYTYILQLFVNGILRGKYNDIILKIINEIINGCKHISLKVFEDLDKQTSIDVYSFISKYKNIFHINQETLDIVRNIVLEKCKEDQLFILNPSIDDLFENNFYKLYVNNLLYLVPLWHNELYFDSETSDIIVKCIPDLPENVAIDEDNNLIVNLYIPFSISILDEVYFEFYLGKQLFNIPISELKLKVIQTYILKDKGITKIKENDITDLDMYDISNKSDIIIKIHFINK